MLTNILTEHITFYGLLKAKLRWGIIASEKLAGYS